MRCYKDRAVIPAALRPQVLETIHAAHQGVSGMIIRIEETALWPGISTDVIKTRGGCLIYVKNASPVAPPVRSFPICGGELLQPRGDELPRAGGQVLRMVEHYTY